MTYNVSSGTLNPAIPYLTNGMKRLDYFNNDAPIDR